MHLCVVIKATMIKESILKYLKSLSETYETLGGTFLSVAICGGAALNILDIVHRTTQDIDLVSPEHLPPLFTEASNITAQYFNLKSDWINQGPVDLLKMGLPEGYFERCHPLTLGGNITWLITSRFDQIHFKLYASIDRGGYHVQDLVALKPSSEELIQAVQWCFTQDVSEPFRLLTLDFLQKHGWKNAAQKLSQTN